MKLTIMIYVIFDPLLVYTVTSDCLYSGDRMLHSYLHSWILL